MVSSPDVSDGHSPTLRRISDDAGDTDVINWDLSEGSKVKLLGLSSSHIRSGCPWRKGNLTLTQPGCFQICIPLLSFSLLPSPSIYRQSGLFFIFFYYRNIPFKLWIISDLANSQFPLWQHLAKEGMLEGILVSEQEEIQPFWSGLLLTSLPPLRNQRLCIWKLKWKLISGERLGGSTFGYDFPWRKLSQIES